MNKIGVYPGTFDPPTNGHIDIACRAAKLFDKLIIAVSDNPAKKPMFTIEERLEMLREIFNHNTSSIEIKSFSNLLIRFAEMQDAIAVVRGLRAVSDFEYELQLASFNSELNSNIETVFFMAKNENLFISSSLIKEIAKFGGDVSSRVPPPVWEKLKQKFSISG